MKDKVLYFLLLVGILLPSCNDNYLDIMPSDQKTMDMVWKSQKETEAYLYNIYSQIPDESNLWSNCPWIGCSDEADMHWSWYPTAHITAGDWSPLSQYFNHWGPYYNSIRCSFVFENNVDKCSELTTQLKHQYKAEAKFLRGYFYWKLLQQYGPFVLIDRETSFNENWNSYSRTPYDDCIRYIVRMMDEAEVDLPSTWNQPSTSVWLGKPDKIACKGIKTEVLIMAASPQWNGNMEYKNFVNKDGTPLVNTIYSLNKWRLAAQAAKDVITLGESAGLKLYRNDENGNGSSFNPYLSCRDVHIEKWNCESVWSTTVSDFPNIDKHSTPRPGGWCGMAATQRQVDAFYTINGRTIEDPASDYSEIGFAQTSHKNWVINSIDQVRKGESWGHRKGEFNMYANREARFYAAILYNGRPIPQSERSDRNVYSSNANKDGWGRAELYSKGVSGNSDADHTPTGYLILKMVDPSSNPYKNNHGAWHQHVEIRLAQVYLNYIEALNEFDPENADIRVYWDKIRSRAGLPSIFNTYPEILGNKEKQLEYILRERQVELCFEGDRYFTTRRRLLADKVDTSRPEERRMFGDGGPMYGMNINAGTSFSDLTFYRRTKFEDRVFEKKMYLFPINQTELDKNKVMVQNPGW